VPAHPPFSVAVRHESPLPVVVVAGELDVATAPALRDALLGLLRDDAVPDVAVDLSAVTFLDSSGLGVLLMGARRWASAQKRFVLREPSRVALRVIDLTGARRAFEYESD
jgi:anti-sigma B factor antagonist